MTRDEKIKFLKNEFVDTKEVCNILGLSRQMVHRLMKQGKIQVVHKINGGNLFLREDIEEYVKRRIFTKQKEIVKRTKCN